MNEVAIGDTLREIRAAAGAVRESSTKIATAVEHASSAAISVAYFAGVRDGCVACTIVLMLLYFILTKLRR
ncbi:MAG: hypothetical protein KatS3mg015_3031 [Fimbriimonadales bacterium]|nr:MAG: hypothetical protein KatS3mg015_3031 [Fimbriimonadales bacterium]